MRPSLPALLALGAAPLTAQTPRTFTPIAELTIDAATADLNGRGMMTVAPDGTMLIAQMNDRHVKTFTAAGKPGTIGRDGEGPGEFRRPIRLGVFGDTLWVADPVLHRLTFFGPDRKVLRTQRLPVSGSERFRTSTEDSAVTYFYQAPLPDGGLRAVAMMSGARGRPAWAQGVDSAWGVIVAVTAEGRFRHRIAVERPTDCTKQWRSAQSVGAVQIPFCFRRQATDWKGGTDVGVVEPIIGDRRRYRIALHGVDGRLRFTRDVPFTPIAVTRPGLDSAQRQIAQRKKETPPDLLSGFPFVQPMSTRPPVRDIAVGRDGALWVNEETGTPAHHWRIYDPRGTVIGVVTLPHEVTLAVADRERIWGFTTDPDGLVGIVRYRLR